MSKKSKKKREERKKKRSRSVAKSPKAGFADAKVRASCLRSVVRQIPRDLKQALTMRCGAPETVSFVLVADPSIPPPGPTVTRWLMSTFDGVAVLVAPGTEDKVVVDSFVLCRGTGDVTSNATSDLTSGGVQ